MNLKSFLLKLKSKLPFNGDWLWVTLNFQDNNELKEKENDISGKYSTFDAIHSEAKTKDKAFLNLAFTEAEKYYIDTKQRSQNLKNKAIPIIKSSSFVSATILGSFALLSSNILKMPFWVVIIETILFLFVISHLSNSLIKAISSVTREESIDFSTIDIIEILKAKSSKKFKEIYKNLIIKHIYYSNLTQEFLQKQVNKLIISQNALKYGIIFFILFIICSITLNIIYPPESKFDTFLIQYNSMIERQAELNKEILQNLNEINKGISNLNNNIKITNISKEIILLQQELATINEHISELRKELILNNNNRLNN